MPRYWESRYPLVPWSDVEPSDLREANEGDLELVRDLLIEGQAERHIGMLCVGQYDRSMALGLIAIRCERHGAQLVPLTCAIPETPTAVVRQPVSAPVQSNPVRRSYRDDVIGDFSEGDGA